MNRGGKHLHVYDESQIAWKLLMSRGGKRPGSGRKAGSTKPVTIRMEKSIISDLRRKIPAGARSKFISESVKEALEK